MRSLLKRHIIVAYPFHRQLIHPGHHRPTDMDNTRGQRSWHWSCESKAQADASLCGTVYVRCYLWLPWGCY
ncbi:hypothetical protein PV327_000130 [Microctonus hyperodae]|uniref:Uncharacterized protein n=1 Tax=Microctonus hyperodae TaxID=165561 RepID=A0AA39G5Y0_MICHY|nr:hypothetical protein PV327_000130 [Microctonus hyperodae]